MTGLVSFVLAALALVGSPGPNTLSLAAVGASFGRRRGLNYMIGLSFGVMLVLAITATGLAALILSLPGAATVVSIAALIYLLYLAYRIATAPVIGVETERKEAAPRWHQGIVISISNPKAYAAMGALLSGPALVPGNAAADVLWKASVAFLVICVVNLAWLSFGAAITHFVRTPRRARALNLGFAALLLISVAALGYAQILRL